MSAQAREGNCSSSRRGRAACNRAAASTSPSCASSTTASARLWLSAVVLPATARACETAAARWPRRRFSTAEASSQLAASAGEWRPSRAQAAIRVRGRRRWRRPPRPAAPAPAAAGPGRGQGRGQRLAQGFDRALGLPRLQPRLRPQHQRGGGARAAHLGRLGHVRRRRQLAPPQVGARQHQQRARVLAIPLGRLARQIDRRRPVAPAQRQPGLARQSRAQFWSPPGLPARMARAARAPGSVDMPWSQASAALT